MLNNKDHIGWLEKEIGEFDVIFVNEELENVMVADMNGIAYEVYQVNGELRYNKA
jgi:hypothetical protein